MVGAVITRVGTKADFHQPPAVVLPRIAIMKNQIPSLATIVLSCAALVLAACSKQERHNAADKTRDAMHDAQNAMSNAWGDVKTYTYEKRDDFTRSAKAMSAQMDAKLSEVRANYSEEKASASRRAAMDELKNAEADYRQKLSALGDASADTWEAAKNNVILAWDKLQAAYRRARAD
jgi:hypothetical protein